ncbi:phosphoenolpyruvate synthase [Thermovibrio ammonificans HB-1]|uniref:Phosphoenolpyruvate synthase n=1 Tax=Thermovibrio ammonificans (strain DSM 15698 / JCM 12110 / HB-1) TaxID=648996 RepID=E8T244_THEA1|nr:phosphoenolpyruvate synthase [Thermovibrio ammonificans]ADU96939.1 phosphoenolpyruvate synthase [Thermovibrio ammonificans HB-1]
MEKGKLVVWLEEVGIEDVPLVGGKNASLGEMMKALKPKGVNIPDGFVITAESYRYFIKYNNLEEKIREVLKGLNVNDVDDLHRRGEKVRELIKSGKFPQDLKELIKRYYRELSERFGTENVDVAVRSSATAEDLPNASFAGQQETYLNVRGIENLLNSVKKCFASLFTDRAISYRETFGFDHFKVALSVGVQKMVRSDLASSGVGFSLDTESGFKDVVLVTGSYGLGEMIVKGAVTPDEWLVFKPTLKKGFKAIIEKKLGDKKQKMVYGDSEKEPVKVVPVPLADREKFCLTDDEVLTLAKWITEIEEYYSKKHGRWTPMDVEWAKDGERNELYIVQARPETVHSHKDYSKITVYKVTEPPEEREKKVLVKGIAVGRKIATGTVKVLMSVEEADRFNEGDVLVTDMTDPDWEPIMKKASAIVTNRGGRTCHAAIVARELGVPAVVGTGNATEVLKEGQEVTVSCAEGTVGYVYEGKIAYEVEEVDLNTLPKPKTPIMFNIATPEGAFDLSFLPNAGVGLAREEFIINNYIGIHPNALIKFDEIKEKDPQLAEEIERRTKGYSDKRKFYVDKLAFGIARIAAAFYPKPVIVRFSDFKSNEYANLLGGKYFEPKEENPMLGWRGASRYYSENFAEAFGLECLAIKKVREEMGLENVIVMVPFCRTPKEGKKVQEVMERFGLKRGEKGLKVYVMCEIPSNVILFKEFAEEFDGFSIGSNDLTQLTLGVDRDSSLVAHIYDERNEAVKWMVGRAIEEGKKYNRKVGICGQAPSDHPDFAQFLVEKGIDTISINPDSILEVIRAVYEIEKRLGLH